MRRSKAHSSRLSTASRRKTQKIKFAAHKDSLTQQAKDLKSSLRHDWHDGTDDQIEIKGGIVMEVLQWVSDLFKVAIDKGVELAAVQKCLIFMETQMLETMHDNCRTEYEMCCDCFNDSVTDSAGAVRYQGAPDSVIPHFWRDVLLMAIIQGDKAVLDMFKAHYNRPGKKSDGPWGPPENLTNVLPDAKQGKGANKDWEDSWHTDAMTAAVPKLLALLQA